MTTDSKYIKRLRKELLAGANSEKSDPVENAHIEQRRQPALQTVVKRARRRKTKVDQYQFARIAFSEANRVLGNATAAWEFLNDECQALGFVRPITLFQDAAGLEKVRVILLRIEHGVYT